MSDLQAVTHSGRPDAGDPGVDRPRLERNLRSVRTLFSLSMSGGIVVLSIVAAFPLFSVLYMLIREGGASLTSEVFTETPPTPMEAGGGFGNAILGTMWIVGIASLLAVPFGIMAAICLAQLERDGRRATLLRSATKVLTGLPSILAGVFAYALIVLTTGRFSAVAGGIALSVLMLPTVILTAEEALRAVPGKMKEAAIAMGATPTQVMLRVTLPTALPAVLTGVMLAVARAAGETAPLLFTALFSYHWPVIDRLEPTASLAVLIYNFSGVPFENQVRLAWTASLVLVFLVLLVNITGQVLTGRSLAKR